MSALEVVILVASCIASSVAVIWRLGVIWDKIQYRLERNERDINGVAQNGRRLVGLSVREAVCAEHGACAHCRERRDQAARLIEGR